MVSRVDGKGQVLVRNYYSLISAGTEGSTVKATRKGYIGKAKEKPQEVKRGHRYAKNSEAGANLSGCNGKTGCLFSPWIFLWG